MGVYFSSYNNVANVGFFAKVSVLVKSTIPWSVPGFQTLELSIFIKSQQAVLPIELRNGSQL